MPVHFEGRPHSSFLMHGMDRTRSQKVVPLACMMHKSGMCSKCDLKNFGPHFSPLSKILKLWGSRYLSQRNVLQYPYARFAEDKLTEELYHCYAAFFTLVLSLSCNLTKLLAGECNAHTLLSFAPVHRIKKKNPPRSVSGPWDARTFLQERAKEKPGERNWLTEREYIAENCKRGSQKRAKTRCLFYFPSFLFSLGGSLYSPLQWGMKFVLIIVLKERESARSVSAKLVWG